jgi:hypothetical protein
MGDNKKGLDKVKSCGVRCEGGKYYCTDCGTEVKANQNCPECKSELDWVRAGIDLKRTLV